MCLTEEKLSTIISTIFQEEFQSTKSKECRKAPRHFRGKSSKSLRLPAGCRLYSR